MSESPFPFLSSDNEKIALVEGANKYTYSKVNKRINLFASGILKEKEDLNEERIAFFLSASLDYVTTIQGVWKAGGIAVPLNVASAVPELDHYLTCAKVTRLIAGTEYHDYLRELCDSLGIELLSVNDVLSEKQQKLPTIDPQRRSMILFTSGTTNKPKGVVSTHKTIEAQIRTLITAWEWSESDVIPLFLPLHHIHGIINILSCGLWAGATIHLFAKFNIPKISEQIKQGTYNVFMAVPTVYVKLIQYFETQDQNELEGICAGFKAMRLNISGSAACPVQLFEQWKELTGQTLLERYGMTEIGMGISNPYNGERRAGAVGLPLPGVECQLFDENNNPVEKESEPGEIRIKGDNVFLEYWDNEEATKRSFKDGWFCTGDVAVIEQQGYYRIMGRSSVDIIKSGGYKLSAIEIEGVLLTHDSISEVAVVGVEDNTWGEAVMAFAVVKKEATLEFDALKSWCEGKMSSYKIPKRLKIIEALPRNAMGKVTKPSLKKLL